MISLFLAGAWVSIEDLKRLGVEYRKNRLIYGKDSAVVTDTGLAFVKGVPFPLTLSKENGVKFKGEELAPVLFNLGLKVFWDYEREILFKGKPTIKRFNMVRKDTNYVISIEGGSGFEVQTYEDSIVIVVDGLYGKYRKVVGDGRFVSFVDILHTSDKTRFSVHLGFGAGKILKEEIKGKLTLKILPLKVPKKKDKVPTIVIDPGHGGKDPGAMANSYKEKDINLQVALKVAKILREQGYNVILTREEDEYVPLSTRARIANKNSASIFVSIHSNFDIGGSARGLETYFFSESRTTEERAVALLENSAIKYDLGNFNPKDELGVILGDMIQTFLLEQSYKLASFIHQRALELKLTEDRGLRQANFYVLRWVSAPSVLIELGFLSNPEEAKMLASEEYQMKLARAIAMGIMDYFEKERR
jgi:N-acetylmuramoyl-L-alanine amidase